MVYLFGGAFLLGASNDLAILGDSLYDGKEMADRGGVIVVTVNYRVGTLGFLSSGDQRLPGLQNHLTTHQVCLTDKNVLGVNVRVLVGEVLQRLLVVSQHACDQNSGYDWSYQRVHRSVFSSAAWRPFEVNAHNVLKEL